MSAQSLGDSVVAYDFNAKLLCVFSRAGAIGRCASPASSPYKARVVDDSLLLFIRHPGQGGNLLALTRLDGTPVSEFFDAAAFFQNRALRYLSFVSADARDGLVYATLFGSDSLHIFDYSGRAIATVAIPSRVQMNRLDDLLRQHGGRFQDADSVWFHHGMHAVMNLVAMNGYTLALQIGTYDARIGTDLFNGGEEILVLRAAPPEHSTVVRHLDVRGAIAGRDVDGSLLTIGYADSTRQTFVLQRFHLE